MKRRLLLLLFLIGQPLGHAKVIHSERSLYQNIIVSDSGEQRCLQFSIRSDQRNQSCKDQTQPMRLVFTYTRMMLASLMLNPAPERVLIVGLGGGTLPETLARLYPAARIDIVEIDEAVVRVAKEYFGFKPTFSMRIFEQDARVWGRRALSHPERYDLILLDAFNGDYIPEHLMTREYLDETRQLLTPNGVLAANTFAISDLYAHESVTYEHVFGRFFNLRQTDSANRVILASRSVLPDGEMLKGNAARLAPQLEAFGVDLQDYVARMSIERDWRTDARVLTDQYAPANLLRERNTED